VLVNTNKCFPWHTLYSFEDEDSCSTKKHFLVGVSNLVFNRWCASAHSCIHLIAKKSNSETDPSANIFTYRKIRFKKSNGIPHMRNQLFYESSC